MNKKTAIIISISVIVILIIAGLVWFFVANKNDDKNENQETTAQESRTQKVYDKLKNSESYQFVRKVDDNNQVLIAKKADRAYEEEIYDGSKTNYIVKDGDLYLISPENQRYYKYQNNDEILHLIENAFAKIQDKTYTEGKEEINGKNYKYEEFSGIQEFLVDSNLYSANEDNIKTRFYYSGNDLKYIKTITESNEELLEIKIEYEADDSLFEIPEGYTDGDNS